jgi:CRISPR-associated endonuclease/helicase Cas3
MCSTARCDSSGERGLKPLDLHVDPAQYFLYPEVGIGIGSIITQRAMNPFCAEKNDQFLAHLESGREQLLRDHLRGVSVAARRNADKLGLGPAGALIGTLHDLGKYSRTFQQYLRRMALNQDTEQDSERGKIDHSTAGAQTIWRSLKSRGAVEGIVGEILAICVASHHSGLIDCIMPDGFDNLSRRMDKADADSHFDEAWTNAESSVIGDKALYLGNPNLISGIRERIGLICRADQAELIRRFKIGLLIRFLFSCLIDADRTDTADFSNGAVAALRQHGRYAGWRALADLLERKLRGFSNDSAIDKLRRQVSESCLSASGRPKGTYLLTVPTGGGKTLASLRFALNHAAKWNMDRVIYVSPYTSIIDQNAAVVRGVLEPEGTEFASVVLEHHSNLTPLKQTWRSKILSENWDAPVVFTTAVQLLEALFGSGTRAVRRMHQMADSVLIFDEIQTLPVRCVHLFNNALNYLVEQCGTSVVLCTATQPLLHQVDASKGAIRLDENAEIMRNVASLFAQIPRYEVYDRRKARGWDHTDAAELAAAETRELGSCLIVVNTKSEALSIFKKCKATESDVTLRHLSTSMCPAHRIRILDELKKHLDEHTPVICVSTQLIEAGVDISFGSVIRALAGIDSIAQTAGRCNRNGESDLGRVHVINLAGELPKALRDIRAAQEAAQRVLDENASKDEGQTVDLSDPKIVEQYFQYYFFDRREEMDYPVGPKQAERDDTLLNMLAENSLAVANCTPRPQVYLRQAFKTAAEAFLPIDANTRGVVVPYTSEGEAVIGELCAAYELKKQTKLLKRAQQFTVNVFPYVLDRLQRAGAVYETQVGTGVLCLREKWYNDEFGLNEEGTEEMGVLDA